MAAARRPMQARQHAEEVQEEPRMKPSPKFKGAGMGAGGADAKKRAKGLKLLQMVDLDPEHHTSKYACGGWTLVINQKELVVHIFTHKIVVTVFDKEEDPEEYIASTCIHIYKPYKTHYRLFANAMQVIKEDFLTRSRVKRARPPPE